MHEREGEHVQHIDASATLEVHLLGSDLTCVFPRQADKARAEVAKTAWD